MLQNTEKNIFLQNLQGSKFKEKRERKTNESRISTPHSRLTPMSRTIRSHSVGDRTLKSPFRPLQYPSENC